VPAVSLTYRLLALSQQQVLNIFVHASELNQAESWPESHESSFEDVPMRFFAWANARAPPACLSLLFLCSLSQPHFNILLNSYLVILKSVINRGGPIRVKACYIICTATCTLFDVLCLQTQY
jgi:hypothetical protein